MTKPELRDMIDRLRREIADTSWWMAHTDTCDIERADVCTCGMTQVKDHARQTYEDTKLV